MAVDNCHIWSREAEGRAKWGDPGQGRLPGGELGGQGCAGWRRDEVRRQLVLGGSTSGRVQAVGSRSTEEPSAQEESLSSVRPSGTPTVPGSPNAV